MRKLVTAVQQLEKTKSGRSKCRDGTGTVTRKEAAGGLNCGEIKGVRRMGTNRFC